MDQQLYGHLVVPAYMELINTCGESYNTDMDQLWAQGSNPGTGSMKLYRWDLCVLSRLCQSFCETKSLDLPTIQFNMSYARSASSNFLTLCYFFSPTDSASVAAQPLEGETMVSTSQAHVMYQRK